MALKTYMLQLYGNISDEMSQRFLDEMNYYMYEAKNKETMIHFEEVERSIIITVNTDEWTLHDLGKLLRNILRDTNHVIFPMERYSGWHEKSFWNLLKGKKAKPLFEKTSEFRKINKRKNKLSQLTKLILGSKNK